MVWGAAENEVEEQFGKRSRERKNTKSSTVVKLLLMRFQDLENYRYIGKHTATII